jgi:hypothetical protein
MDEDRLYDRAQGILRVDREREMWDHRWGGTRLWPLVRRSVYDAGESTQPHPPRDVAALVGDLVRSTVFKHRGRVGCLLNDSLISVDGDGQFLDAVWGCSPFQSPEVQILIGANAGRVPPHPWPSTAGMHALSGMMARGCAAVPGPREVDDFLTHLAMHLPEHGLSTRQVSGLAIRHRLQVAWWKLVFRRWKPQRILVADPEERALVEAARARKIPVWELQHGIITDWHPGYQWGSIPREGAESLLLPDRLLTWGEGWTDLLRDHPWWSTRTHTFGAPGFSPVVGVPEPGLALYTAGGADGLAAGTWLRRMLDVLPPTATGRLEIRPHPRYQGDLSDLRQAIGSHPRVTFTTPGDESLAHALGRASLHLSIGSTCHYQAASIGIPTIVIPGAGWRTSEPLLRDRAAFLMAPEQAADLLVTGGLRCPTGRWLRSVLPQDLDDVLSGSGG